MSEINSTTIDDIYYIEKILNLDKNISKKYIFQKRKKTKGDLTKKSEQKEKKTLFNYSSLFESIHLHLITLDPNLLLFVFHVMLLMDMFVYHYQLNQVNP